MHDRDSTKETSETTPMALMVDAPEPDVAVFVAGKGMISFGGRMSAESAFVLVTPREIPEAT
jgi:hypothetical protein